MHRLLCVETCSRAFFRSSSRTVDVPPIAVSPSEVFVRRPLSTRRRHPKGRRPKPFTVADHLFFRASRPHPPGADIAGARRNRGMGPGCTSKRESLLAFQAHTVVWFPHDRQSASGRGWCLRLDRSTSSVPEPFRAAFAGLEEQHPAWRAAFTSVSAAVRDIPPVCTYDASKPPKGVASPIVIPASVRKGRRERLTVELSLLTSMRCWRPPRSERRRGCGLL